MVEIYVYYTRLDRGQLLEHAQELLDRLALPENDLGKSAAQIAMVIDASVAQILERKPFELLNGLIRGQITPGDPFEQVL